MQTIGIEIDTLTSGEVMGYFRIPARRCGAPNLAAAERARQLLKTIEPDAYDPVPEAVAEAVIRDVLPPNCDGNATYAANPGDSTGRLPRAQFPPFDDDFGAEAEPARYPPGVACSITGECE